jgi:DNA sulfur modification protein DndC
LIDDPILEAIERTSAAITTHSSKHWVIGFSGGKDSSAALKIFLEAYRRSRTTISNISLIYCDTGVENIILDSYVKTLLREMKDEFEELKLPIKIDILKAPVQNRFFVRIVGRGYPPPTNSFRWCTKSLRIEPVQKYIKNQVNQDAVVVLGLRRNESAQRDRSLGPGEGGYWQPQREGETRYDIFTPIIALDVPLVWDVIFWLPSPKSLRPNILDELYRGASGECPIVKSPQSPPCASGRFGCWVCTVVRKDKSAMELVRSGRTELKPFLQFRDWLAQFRNDPENRWATRRNGNEGLGPFTIQARKEILHRIDSLEAQTGEIILDFEERGLIARLWELDHLPRISFRGATPSYL